MHQCAVVILNWNGSRYLQKFLPILLQHTPESLAEIVVADNCSTDDSMQVIGQYSNIKTIRFDKNYGFAEGYNRALEQIRHEYVVLLNSDVAVTENWLQPLLSYLDENPTVAACQPKILAYNAPKNFEHAGAAGGFVDRWGYPFCRGRVLNHTEEDKGQHNTPITCFWATGACFVTRTAVFKQVGGFDSAFFAHMEEIDLCWRLWARGYQVAALPHAAVYHVGAGTLTAESPFKTYLNFRNNLLMLYKNLPTKRLASVMLIRFVLDYMAVLRFLITGKASNAKAACKARVDFWKMRHLMVQKRFENRTRQIYDATQQMSKRSIIIDFYLFGKRT